MNEIVDKALTFIKKHQFWAELGTYLLLALGSAFWVGRAAYKEAATLAEQGHRLESVRASADTWIRTFNPASNAEAQEWQIIQNALQQLGAGNDSRLTLVEVLTRRGERAGLSSVRAGLAPPDSAPAIPRAGAPPVTFKVADYTIIVDFKGNLASTRSFLANLPPSIGVQRISMSRSGSTMGTRAVLTVYEAVADAPI